MEHNPAVVLIGQGPHSTSDQGGSGAHLEPEGGTLQVSLSMGRGDPDTNATSRYPRRTPGRGVDCFVSVDNMHREGVRHIGDDSRESEEVDKGGNTVKGPRPTMVG